MGLRNTNSIPHWGSILASIWVTPRNVSNSRIFILVAPPGQSFRDPQQILPVLPYPGIFPTSLILKLKSSEIHEDVLVPVRATTLSRPPRPARKTQHGWILLNSLYCRTPSLLIQGGGGSQP